MISAEAEPGMGVIPYWCYADRQAGCGPVSSGLGPGMIRPSQSPVDAVLVQ